MKRGKREERGKRSITSLVPYPVRALWPVVRVRRRPGTKGSQLHLLGLVHHRASWFPSTPSGENVSRSEEEAPPESPFVAGRGTPPGPRVGSCLTLRNELFEETHMLTKQETLLGRGTGQRAGG